ncbi:MAG: 50S ribosomal protein L7/L12 [Candidatus Parcubacteria bacterium]|nr:MAG: 50S ribosomal protein L7/L12 [Candidatus Parcubacteria bacterium]
MSEKINEIIEKIENLTVVELNELIKQIEEKFGISSLPMFSANVATSIAENNQESQSQPSKVNVVLVDSGANKIQVIKALKEINPQLGLKEAKEIADNPPRIIKENIDLAEANKIKEKIESVGGKIEIK